MDASGKKLLVLDVNGLLIDTYYEGATRPDRQHDKKVKKFYVYKRPFCDEFIQFCLTNFVVGVWSSALEHNVLALVDYIFKEAKEKLAFVWHQQHCTDTGSRHPDNKYKPLFLKELWRLWKKYEANLPWAEGSFGPSNTLLIDDSAYKAINNPAHTAIFPKSYCASDVGDNYLDGELRTYLEGLLKSTDVRAYLEGHPIGEPSIAIGDPKWSEIFVSVKSKYEKEQLIPTDLLGCSVSVILDDVPSLDHGRKKDTISRTKVDSQSAGKLASARPPGFSGSSARPRDRLREHAFTGGRHIIPSDLASHGGFVPPGWEFGMPYREAGVPRLEAHEIPHLVGDSGPVAPNAMVPLDWRAGNHRLDPRAEQAPLDALSRPHLGRYDPARGPPFQNGHRDRMIHPAHLRDYRRDDNIDSSRWAAGLPDPSELSWHRGPRSFTNEIPHFAYDPGLTPDQRRQPVAWGVPSHPVPHHLMQPRPGEASYLLDPSAIPHPGPEWDRRAAFLDQRVGGMTPGMPPLPNGNFMLGNRDLSYRRRHDRSPRNILESDPREYPAVAFSHPTDVEGGRHSPEQFSPSRRSPSHVSPSRLRRDHAGADAGHSVVTGEKSFERGHRIDGSTRTRPDWLEKDGQNVMNAPRYYRSLPPNAGGMGRGMITSEDFSEPGIRGHQMRRVAVVDTPRERTSHARADLYGSERLEPSRSTDGGPDFDSGTWLPPTYHTAHRFLGRSGSAGEAPPRHAGRGLSDYANASRGANSRSDDSEEWEEYSNKRARKSKEADGWGEGQIDSYDVQPEASYRGELEQPHRGADGWPMEHRDSRRGWGAMGGRPLPPDDYIASRVRDERSHGIQGRPREHEESSGRHHPWGTMEHGFEKDSQTKAKVDGRDLQRHRDDGHRKRGRRVGHRLGTEVERDFASRSYR